MSRYGLLLEPCVPATVVTFLTLGFLRLQFFISDADLYSVVGLRGERYTLADLSDYLVFVVVEEPLSFSQVVTFRVQVFQL